MHWLLLLAKLKTKEVERNQRVNLISQCTDIKIQIQYGQRNAKSKDSKFTFFSRKRFWFPWNWEKEERGVREDWIRLRRDTWNLIVFVSLFCLFGAQKDWKICVDGGSTSGLLCSGSWICTIQIFWFSFLFPFLSFSF